MILIPIIGIMIFGFICLFVFLDGSSLKIKISNSIILIFCIIVVILAYRDGSKTNQYTETITTDTYKNMKFKKSHVLILTKQNFKWWSIAQNGKIVKIEVKEINEKIY